MTASRVAAAALATVIVIVDLALGDFSRAAILAGLTLLSTAVWWGDARRRRGP